MTRTIARWILAAGLGAIGVLHFVQTRGFRVVVPDWATRMSGLDKETIVVASGAVEIGLAAGLVALPRERARIGWATALFFAAVLPGNVHQWRTGRPAPLMRKVLTLRQWTSPRHREIVPAMPSSDWSRRLIS